MYMCIYRGVGGGGWVNPNPLLVAARTGCVKSGRPGVGLTLNPGLKVGTSYKSKHVEILETLLRMRGVRRVRFRLPPIYLCRYVGIHAHVCIYIYIYIYLPIPIY